MNVVNDRQPRRRQPRRYRPKMRVDDDEGEDDVGKQAPIVYERDERQMRRRDDDSRDVTGLRCESTTKNEKTG
ncbi:unnamed protein product [Linum trigynum]|uniref:Uncharacterized protein n=1 Tax=Linum trigynum TaxID=586398 RepID=A0AAV2DQU0_9ROSI